jgi:hypothetical protein
MDTTRELEGRDSKIESLERDYLHSKAQIRNDLHLSYEKKELRVKQLTDEYYARRRKLEQEAA